MVGGRRVAWVALLLGFSPGHAGAHPIHASLTQLRYDAARRTVDVSIRLFAQDVLDALKRRGPGTTAPAADAPGYALARFALYLGDRPLSLEACGVRQSGDLLWLCLAARGAPGLAGLTVSNRLLVELFDDQVNIVQADADGRRLSLLFTKGDGAKALR